MEHKKQMSIKQFFTSLKNDTNDDIPSTSKMQESSVTNDCVIEIHESDEDCQMLDVAMNYSPDVIENSQDDKEKIHKKKVKIDNSNKFQDRHNDIVNLMNMMHGGSSSSGECSINKEMK